MTLPLFALPLPPAGDSYPPADRHYRAARLFVVLLHARGITVGRLAARAGVGRNSLSQALHRHPGHGGQVRRKVAPLLTVEERALLGWTATGQLLEAAPRSESHFLKARRAASDTKRDGFPCDSQFRTNTHAIVALSESVPCGTCSSFDPIDRDGAAGAPR